MVRTLAFGRHREQHGGIGADAHEADVGKVQDAGIAHVELQPEHQHQADEHDGHDAGQQRDTQQLGQQGDDQHCRHQDQRRAERFEAGG